jgi:hypothetical protein
MIIAGDLATVKGYPEAVILNFEYFLRSLYSEVLTRVVQ